MEVPFDTFAFVCCFTGPRCSVSWKLQVLFVLVGQETSETWTQTPITGLLSRCGSESNIFEWCWIKCLMKIKLRSTSSDTIQHNPTWNEHVTVAVESQFKQFRSSPKKKFFGASTGFEPVDSAFALQSSTSWAMKTHTWRAGQFIELINPWKEWNTEWNDVNWGNTNETNMWPSQLNRNLSNSEVARKKFSGASMGFEPVASSLALQWLSDMLYSTVLGDVHEFFSGQTLTKSVIPTGTHDLGYEKQTLSGALILRNEFYLYQGRFWV